MAVRKAGLGRGLEALIPAKLDETPDAEFLQVAIDQITVNPDQPRSRFDDVAQTELAASIEDVGVLQPIVVTKGDNG